MTIQYSLKEKYDRADKRTTNSVDSATSKINFIPLPTNNLPKLIKAQQKSMGVSLEEYTEIYNVLCPKHKISIDSFGDYIYPRKNRNSRPLPQRMEHLIDYLNIDE